MQGEQACYMAREGAREEEEVLLYPNRQLSHELTEQERTHSHEQGTKPFMRRLPPAPDTSHWAHLQRQESHCNMIWRGQTYQPHNCV